MANIGSSESELITGRSRAAILDLLMDSLA
jgi:hypothetical protein